MSTRLFVSCVLAVLCAAAVAQPFELPLESDFADPGAFKSGPLGEQRGWKQEQGEIYIVDNQQIRYLSIPAGDPAGQASFYFRHPEAGRPVFFDMTLQLGAGGEAMEFADINGALVSLLRVEADGRLLARHHGEGGAGAWLDTQVRIGLDETGAGRDWTRLGIRQDTAAGTWDLYIGGVMKAANLGSFPDARESGGYFTLLGNSDHELRLSRLRVSGENPFFPDADGDGLPDSWQKNLSRRSREEDADNDGLTNLEEYLNGTHPGKADTDGDGMTDAEELRGGTDALKPQANARGGNILGEYWLPDSLFQSKLPPSLYECRRDGLFERAPSKNLPLDRLDFEDLFETGYASRVRGLITAPVTGDYTFWISGGDSAEFWLSADDSPFLRKFIARTPAATRYQEFDQFGSQKSWQVSLEAGHSYYFEVLHHVTNAGTGQFSVAWQVPGWKREIVSGQWLGAWTGDERDADSDGLPDIWQRRALSVKTAEALGGLLSRVKGATASAQDPDGDGMSNLEEYQNGTDPARADAMGRAGSLTREVWFGMPGRYLFDTRGSEAFPRSPWWTEYPDRFEGPRDVGQDYLARIRGFVVIPRAGEYRFHLAGDDQAALWLGRSADKFSREKIAFVPSGTGWQEWGRFPSQTSPPRQLAAGEVLYVEVLHKQGLGDGHVVVAWTRPGSSAPEVIGGEHLISWKPQPDDANDDDLPDAWQNQFGLVEAEGERTFPQIHAWGDADGDGFSNGAEYLGKTNPVDPASCPSRGLQWQLWDQVPGSRLTGLQAVPGFPDKPSRQKFLLNLDYTQQGQNCLSRLRGYVVPPVSGDYFFTLAGADHCELWLSTDDTPFRKKLTAQVALGTPWRFGQMNARQRSAGVPLEAGRKYYLEVLHKKGSGDDSLTVAWNIPGAGGSIITEEHLLPYLKNPADTDDDGLPDAWESAHALNPARAGGDDGPYGDPDHDFLDNFTEWQHGTSPRKSDATQVPGLVQWEVWDSIPGRLASSLAGHPRFPSSPDRRTFISSTELPADRGAACGSRLRGYLAPAVTGTYEILVSGDDQVSLYLSGGEGKFDRRLIAGVPFAVGERDFSRFPEQKAKVALEAGKVYFFELLHKEDYDRNHATLAWIVPGTSEAVIPAGGQIRAFAGDPADRDDDELPDTWEQENHLDPADNGSADQTQGYWGDPDQDGLPNFREWQLKTGPNSRDTDGDGLDDNLEYTITGTDPTIKDDLSLPPPLVIGGTAGSVVRGQAEAAAGGLRSLSQLGAAAFPFSLETDGVVVFRLTARMMPAVSDTPLSFGIRVDGVDAGSVPLVQQPGSPGLVSGRLPHLRKGMHSLQISWAIPEPDKYLLLEDLMLFTLPAPSPDENSPNTVTSTATESLTSPFCLEGQASWFQLVRLNQPAEVRPLPENGWYADVALPADGSALKVMADFENGLTRSEREIAWKACNVFQSGNLLIRAGDALRLTAFPGEVPDPAARISFTVNGTLTAETVPAEPVEHQFREPGTYSISALFLPAEGGLQTKTIEVRVLKAVLPDPVLVSPGQTRRLTLPGVPQEAELFAGSPLYFQENPGADPRTFETARQTPGDSLVAVRMPYRGAILGSATVRALALFSDMDTFYRVASVFPDGTRLIEMDVFMPVTSPGFRVRIDIIVAGVTFEDGSTTKWLTAEDFDASGAVRVRFVVAPGLTTSFCHQMTFFDGDTVLGTR